MRKCCKSKSPYLVELLFQMVKNKNGSTQEISCTPALYILMLLFCCDAVFGCFVCGFVSVVCVPFSLCFVMIAYVCVLAAETAYDEDFTHKESNEANKFKYFVGKIQETGCKN